MGKRKYTDFAVLYRTNAQSRMVEEIFLNPTFHIKLSGVRILRSNNSYNEKTHTLIKQLFNKFSPKAPGFAYIC